jgi:cytochrome bd ubiquinol oxidase subunit II
VDFYLIACISLLFAAIALWMLLGGADFGAGILEARIAFKPDTQTTRRLRQQLQTTMGPVWEANHVWLIAIVVILFVCFPQAYSFFSIHLFIPLILLLIAIIFRGISFTVRAYDPAGPKLMKWYNRIFQVSSLLAPIAVGFMITAMAYGWNPLETDWNQKLFTPWANITGITGALFVSALWSYLASTYFWGDVETPEERNYLRKINGEFFLALCISAILFLALLTLRKDFSNITKLPIFWLAVGGIALARIFMWKFREHLPSAKGVWLLRLLAGFQFSCILTLFGNLFWPHIIRFRGNVESGITFVEAAAHPLMLKIAFWSLVIVLAITIPNLVWLYKVFQKKQH